MTARIDIIAPATIALLGSLVETLDPVPLSIAGTGTITITITAGNAAARLSASAAAGALVTSNGNMLTVSGSAAQVNAALASLAVTDIAPDILAITAGAAGFLAASTTIAVSEIPATGPAFAAPPGSVTISPYSITNVGGLVLGDPAAAALAAAGLGRSETMAVTLSVASGVLFLPSYNPLGGIAAAGAGTSEILLSFTADQLPAVNALLAALAWAGPAAVSGLAFSARDVAGPLGATATSGNIVLDIAGTQGPVVSLAIGADAAILGVSSFSLGTTLDITSITADIGGIGGQAALFIAPDAALTVPYNAISLGGTSYDFGGLSAASLTESGALLAAGGADFTGPVNIGSAGEIDFNGSLIAGGADTQAGMQDISLAAGALLTGAGNLLAGNFSESGAISGSGTILAGAGDTLVIAAGQISGVTLEVQAGGVLELGPVDPLYGVFDATPLTIGSAVTLAFLNDSGAALPAGGFADMLAQTGGVIVITSPSVFNGRIVNFTAGDRLIFPGLTGLTLKNITTNGFVVSGPDGSGVTQTFTINAAMPAGMTPFAGVDAAGDGEVSLRDAQPDVFFGGTAVNQTTLLAQPGTPQPLTGLSVLAGSWNGRSLSVTLAVKHGVLSGPGLASGTLVTVSAASPAAMNIALQGLFYTGTAGAAADLVTITSATGVLNGLFNLLPVSLSAAGGTVVGAFGGAGDIALFNDSSAVPVQAVAAPGELVISGRKVFDASLDIPGLSGTALQIASGGVGIFDPGAQMALGADVTVASGGLLGVLTGQFSMAGNVSILASAIISGAVTAAGSVSVTGNLVSSGNLNAAALVVGQAGAVELDAGEAGFAALNLSGTLAVVNTASLNAGQVTLQGDLCLGGTSSFTAAAVLSSGIITIGPDAAFLAAGMVQTGGVMSVSGLASLAGSLVSDANIVMNGGTLLAPLISLGAAGTISGGGVIGAAGRLGTLVVDGGKILTAGALLLADDVTLINGGAVSLAAASALDLVHGVSGGTLGFAGAGAELTINDVSQFSAAVAGMLDQDAIDLAGVAPSLVSFTAGVMSVRDAAGNLAGQFALGLAAGQPGVSIIADGAGGSLITLGGDMPCFARGTGILTPNGYRAVETLKPGDPVINIGGERRGVRWIGWRTLDLKDHDKAQPVLFAAHSLAAGVPNRPVRLSPLHAVFTGGVLVPACHLVNGATITQGGQAAAAYYHIELDRHEILLADGMPAESYLDTGNRGQLYAETGMRGHATTPCARLVTGGPELAAIRRKLHGIALQAGFRTTYDTALRGVAGTASVLPRAVGKGARRELWFRFPAAARHLGLAARTAAPADTDPESEDRRQLGICIAGPPADVTLGEGWFAKAPDDAGRWMGPGARIAFDGPLRHDLTLSLAAVIRSWVPPAPIVSRDGR